MRALIRLGRAYPASLVSIMLAAITLLSLTAGTRRSPTHTAKSDNPNRILVNSTAGALGGDPGKLTLLDAVAQAANDPADNVIQFDPSLAPANELVIRPATPISCEATTGGNDRIDGGDIQTGVVLDLDACSDAGVIVGGSRKFILANVTLRGGGQRAVLLKDDAQLTLQEVSLRDSHGPGLAAFGRGRLTAIRCHFLNNKTHAIELHGDSAAAIETSDLQANGQSGLAAFDQATATLKECVLEANAEWNIVFTHSSRAQLSSCRLRQGRFAGIDLSESASVRCNDCVIEEANRFGLFLTDNASAELTKTRLRKNGGRGMELQERSRLSLDNSVIENSGEYGLILFGDSTVKATGSLLSGNGAHGASLRGRAAGEFINCTFAGNRYGGIGCLDAADGGHVRVGQCLFHKNGMRPIYRGPLHLDPLVPTPLAISEKIVECAADPNATIELYLDRAGEAGKYLRTIRADAHGHFQVDCREVPDGSVMTATATINGSTSEFNVIAGSRSAAVLSALLGRTGPYSDGGGEADLGSVVRRWKPGTKLIFQLQRPPSAAIERYVRFLVARIGDWTGNAVMAEARIAEPAVADAGEVVVPIRYVGADSPQLLGLGGVTFMKWDTEGHFQAPMEIMLALPKEPEETCPRVLAHEVGHVLGLSHTRVGLLSRMQGKNAPSPGFVNDFSPMLTYYDVLALQLLNDPRGAGVATVGQVLARASESRPPSGAVAQAPPAPPTGQPNYSPRPRPAAPKPKRTQRR